VASRAPDRGGSRDAVWHVRPSDKGQTRPSLLHQTNPSDKANQPEGLQPNEPERSGIPWLWVGMGDGERCITRVATGARRCAR
jgi:hypothetical protein